MKNLLLILTMTAFVSSCSKTQTPADNAVSESSPDVRVEEQSIVLEAPVSAPTASTFFSEDYEGGLTEIASNQAGNSTIDTTAGKLRFSYPSGTSANTGFLNIDTVPGESYSLNFDIEEIFAQSGISDFSVTVRDGLMGVGISPSTLTTISSTSHNVVGDSTGNILNFVATSSQTAIVFNHAADFGIYYLDNISIDGIDPNSIQAQNSNEVIDFGVLSKVGQKSIKRVYISNNTGETRTISDAEIVGDGISVLANTCSSLSNGGLCYMDLQYELVSDSQAGLGGDIIADIVSNDPVDATPDWGILSLKGSLVAEIDDGIVNVSDISLSSEALFFGTLQEGASVTKRVYISNSSTNSLENLVIVVGSPYTIVRNGCDGTLNAKRLCSVDIQLSYDAGVSANAGLSMTADSVDLSSVVASLDGISALEDTDNQFAALDGSGSPVDLTLEGADADYSDIGVGNSRSVRIYFSNQNNDYDFGSPSSVGVLGDVVVDRTSCEGVVKEGSVCYVDLTYTRQLIPATDTKLSIAPGLEYEFALPGGVFDESYFDSAVFQ